MKLADTKTQVLAAPNAGTRADLAPLLLIAAFALLMLPLVGNASTWLTLTLAALAMGCIIYIIAAGMTLIFGLMDVMNFGHGAFVTLGAMVALSVAAGAQGWGGSSLPQAMLILGAAVVAAMLIAAVAGACFERTIIRPVYGAHLRQVLTTVGGMIVCEELIKLVWGPGALPVAVPEGFKGTLRIADFGVEVYRLVAAGVGLAVFAVLTWVLASTRVGLLVRAAVQNRTMVEAMGYRVSILFLGVFVFGAALAGAGGALWGFYHQSVTPQIGTHLNILVFIVVIIGGVGSSFGCLVGAVLIGLAATYIGFLAPKAAAFSNIAVMLLVLLWRPQGLYPVSRLELR